MNAINNVARYGKKLFVTFQLHKIVEPANPLLLRICFLSRLAAWRADHPAPFHDDGGPVYKYERRFQLYQHILQAERLDQAIDYLEFGVGKGNSFRWWVEHNTHPASRFVGFDTFTGLPEEWGRYKEGAFSTQGAPPQVDDSRCSFEVGLFQQRLPEFLQRNPLERRKVVHLDADLYSSTLFALTRLAPVLRTGDVLIFDEFSVPTDEFRAFTDFVTAYQIDYDVLGAVNNYLQVAFRLGRSA